VGESLDDTSIAATVALSSVDTNNADRDAHLRSTEFFGVDAHPTLEFRSTGIAGEGEDYRLEGELTINGRTNPVSFPVEFTGVDIYPVDGSQHAGFFAETTVNRKDYGVDFNIPLGGDKLALGEKIKVELDLQFAAPHAD
jgi:polyisoprenoid-binding protein YceI